MHRVCFVRYHTLLDRYTVLPELPGARLGGGFAVLRGRLHYVGGGSLVRGDFTMDHADHWVMNPDGSSVSGRGRGWTPLASFPAPANHMSAVVFGEKLYTFGGQVADHEGCGNRREVMRYDPDMDSWSDMPPMPEPHGHIQFSVV